MDLLGPLGNASLADALQQCQMELASALLRHDDDPRELSPTEEAWLVAISVALIIFAGLMAGLTLGLLSLDK